ncbi:MAG: nucleotidyltransferase family protein [Elusimicrobiota bacterium]
MNINIVRIRNVLLLDSLRAIDEIIWQKNFSIGVFKGAGMIIKGIYSIDEREMSDIDILVDEKDLGCFIDEIENIGFKKIKDGRNSYYKDIGEKFAPLIFDVHTYFSNINFSDFEFETVKEFKAIKVLTDEWLLITTAVHGIIKHGCFGQRDKSDFLKILNYAKIKDGFLIDKVMEKANKNKLGLILKTAFKVSGIEIQSTQKSLKEMLSFPFIWLSFKKHFTFNEYILPFFYDTRKVEDFINCRVGFKRLISIIARIITNREN